MPGADLTQLAAERRRASAVVWDTNLAGSGLRVSPKGRKTFVAQYRVRGGKEAVESLGIMDLSCPSPSRGIALGRSILPCASGV